MKSPRIPKEPERTKPWIDPVKDLAPKATTLEICGDFQQFAQLMREIVKKKES